MTTVSEILKAGKAKRSAGIYDPFAEIEEENAPKTQGLIDPFAEIEVEKEAEKERAVETISQAEQLYDQHIKEYDAVAQHEAIKQQVAATPTPKLSSMPIGVEDMMIGEDPTAQPKGGVNVVGGMARGAMWLIRPLGALGSAALAPIAAHDYKYRALDPRNLAHAFEIAGRTFYEETRGAIGGTPRENIERGVLIEAIGKENLDKLPPVLVNSLEIFLGVVGDPASLGIPFAKTIRTGLALAAAEGRAPQIFRDTVAEMFSYVDASPRKVEVIGDLAKKADAGDKEAVKTLAEQLDDNVRKQIADADPKSELGKKVDKKLADKKKKPKLKPTIPTELKVPIKTRLESLTDELNKIDLENRKGTLDGQGERNARKIELEKEYAKLSNLQPTTAPKAPIKPQKKLDEASKQVKKIKIGKDKGKPLIEKTKSFTKKKIQGALDEADVKNPKVIKEVELSGEKFLDLTTGSDKRKDAIIEKVKKGQPEGQPLTTDKAPILVVDKDGKVIAHDGRHRAAKAIEDGKPLKAIIVSEEDLLADAVLQSQKFGTMDRGVKVPSLLDGMTHKFDDGVAPPVKTATKARQWKDLGPVAIKDKKTGEIIASSKQIDFNPSRTEGVDEIVAELKILRKKLNTELKVPFEDMYQGFLTKDGQEFVPTAIQIEKLNREVKVGAVKMTLPEAKTFEKKYATLRSEVKSQAERRVKAGKELRAMAPVTAHHTKIYKANKKQATYAAGSWFKSNPDLSKHIQKEDLKRIVQEKLWEHIRKLPAEELKKYAAGTVEAKNKINGIIHTRAKFDAMNAAYDLLGQLSGTGKARSKVIKELGTGKFKVNTQLKESMTGGYTDLRDGITDAAMKQLAMDEVNSKLIFAGTERGATGPGALRARQPRDPMQAIEDLKRAKGVNKGATKNPKILAQRKARRKLLMNRKQQAVNEGKLKNISKEEYAAIKKAEDNLVAAKQELKNQEADKYVGMKTAPDQADPYAEKITRKQEIARRKKELDLDKRKLKALVEIQGRPIKPKDPLTKAQRKEMVTKARKLETEKKILEGKIEAGKEVARREKITAAIEAKYQKNRAKALKDGVTDEKQLTDMEIAHHKELKRATELSRHSYQNQLYSGLPLDQIKARLLDPLTSAWTRGVDNLGGKAAKYLRTQTLKSSTMTQAAHLLIEDFGLTKAFKQIRKEYERSVHRWVTVASDHAQAIKNIDGVFNTAKKPILSTSSYEFKIGSKSDKVTGKFSKAAADLRAKQIAGGSITAFSDKFEAVLKSSRRFERLEKMLTDRGLLGDHQFKRLNKVERAKANRFLSNTPSKKYPEPGIKQKMESLANKYHTLDKKNPKYATMERDIVDEMKALETLRVEEITRLQIHYKNSGKNYFSIIHDKIQRETQSMNKFKEMKFDKRWALRRDNWSVKYSESGDGSLVLTRQGKPMKSPKLFDKEGQKLKKPATLERMIFKGISTEAKDAFLHDLFNRVARSNRWTLAKGANPKKGFTKMPNDPDSWGALAGRQVEDLIYKELMASHKEISQASKVWNRSIGIWKAGKVVWSPRAQARNFMSNLILGDIIADLPISTSALKHLYNIKELGKLKHVAKYGKTNDPILKAFKLDTTLMKSTFTANELEDAMRWLDPTKLTTPGSAMDAIANAFNKGMLAPSRMYGLIEEGMKLTIFRESIKRNLKGRKFDELLPRDRMKLIDEAENLANAALFDYSKVPPAIRWARQGYSPFITFAYKAVPALAKGFARKPWKALKYFAGMYAVEEAFNLMSGDSPEKIEKEKRLLPFYMQRSMVFVPFMKGTNMPGQDSNIRMPFKNKNGDPVYFDLSFIVPWGDLSEGSGDLNMGSRSFMPNNPVWNLYRDFSANEDVFLEKPLTISTDTEMETLGKYAWHALKSIQPGIFDAVQKTVQKLKIYPNDWRGRANSPGQVIADNFLGLKFRDVNVRDAKIFKYKDEIHTPLKDAHKNMMTEYNQIFVKQKQLPSEEKRKLWKESKSRTNADYDRILDKLHWLQNRDDEREN